MSYHGKSSSPFLPFARRACAWGLVLLAAATAPLGCSMMEPRFRTNLTESAVPIPKQFLTIEEFKADGDGAYWLRLVNVADFERTDEADGQVGYCFKPNAFLHTAEGTDPSTTQMLEGVRGFSMRRDPDTERVSMAEGHSLLADQANAAMAQIDPERRLEPGNWESRFAVVDSAHTGLVPAEAECLVRYAGRTVQARGRDFFLAEFEGDLGKVTHKASGVTFTMGFKGYLLLDDAGETVYYSTFRYRGKILKPGAGPLGYTGQQITFLSRPETGEAVVAPDSFPELARLVEEYRPLTGEDGKMQGDKIPEPPEWFAPVWAVSRQANLAAAGGAEGQTNPGPVLIVVAAHAVDGVITLVSNTTYDLSRTYLQGDSNHSFNPFDGDIPSPLGKVYEGGAWLVTKAGEQIGWVDPENVGYYTTVGGAVAKLPGDVASVFVSPTGVQGSGATIGRIMASGASTSTKLTVLGAKVVNATNGAVKLVTKIDPTVVGGVSTLMGIKQTYEDTRRIADAARDRQRTPVLVISGPFTLPPDRGEKPPAPPATPPAPGAAPPATPPAPGGTVQGLPEVLIGPDGKPSHQLGPDGWYHPIKPEDQDKTAVFSLVIRVQDAKGNPVKGATAKVTGPKGGDNATTDGAGKAVVTVLRGQNLVLTVTAKGYKPGAAVVKAEGEASAVTVALALDESAPREALSVTVSRAGGGTSKHLYPGVNLVAQVASSGIPDGAEIGVVEWVVTTPKGKSIPSELPHSGRSGLTLSLPTTKNWALGEYQVVATVHTDQGMLSGRGRFTLRSEWLKVSIAKPAYTGQWSRVRFPEIPFEVIDAGNVRVTGMGAFTDPKFWRVERGQVDFRPTEAHAAHPTFTFSHEEDSVKCHGIVNVRLTIMPVDIDWEKTKGSGKKEYVPFTFTLPDSFEAPFDLRVEPDEGVSIDAKPRKRGRNYTFQGSIILETFPSDVDDVTIDLVDKTGAVARGEIDASDTCECQRPPDDVKQFLKSMTPAAMMALAEKAKAAAASDNEHAMDADKDRITKGIIRFYSWLGGLKKCRHMSNRARNMFRDSAVMMKRAARGDEISEQEGKAFVNKYKGLGAGDFKRGFLKGVAGKPQG